jgi:cytoskeletal protein RodZ
VRFVLEAAFLIVLAVAAGLAELSPTTIVLVMGAAWLLVAVIEWLAWRESPTLTRVREEPAPPAAETPAPPAETTAPPAETTAPPAESGRGLRFWRRRRAEPEPEATLTGEDTQDLAPPAEPEAALRADERTGT